MNMQDWWIGLRGQIDDRLLEKFKMIDEGPQKDGRNWIKTTRNQNGYITYLEISTLKKEKEVLVAYGLYFENINVQE